MTWQSVRSNAQGLAFEAMGVVVDLEQEKAKGQSVNRLEDVRWCDCANC